MGAHELSERTSLAVLLLAVRQLAGMCCAVWTVLRYASNPCNFRITKNIQSPFPPIDEDHLCLCKGDSLPGRNAER